MRPTSRWLARSTLARVALVLAVFITLAALVLSLLPNVPMPPGAFGDKLVHGSGYAALAVCWRLALRVQTRWVLAAVFGFGAAIECLQALTPWRQFEWADMMANGTGAAIGLLVWAAVARLWPMLEASTRGSSTR